MNDKRGEAIVAECVARGMPAEWQTVVRIALMQTAPQPRAPRVETPAAYYRRMAREAERAARRGRA